MSVHMHPVSRLARAALFAAGMAIAGCQSPIADQTDLAEVPAAKVADAAEAIPNGECVDDVDLPDTLAIDKGAGGFVGIWVGRWGTAADALCGVLVVEAVAGDTADVIYSWGTGLTTIPAGRQWHRANVSNNPRELKIYLRQNRGTVTYTFADADTLNGVYLVGGSTSNGVFRRVPLN